MSDITGAPELSQLTGWLEFSTEAARKKQWEYFVIDQFLKGNHNVKGNPQDNTIEVARKTDSINYPINLIKSTFRAVKGYVTRHKPMIDVEVDEETTDKSKAYARRANRLIQRDNKLNNGRRLNKEIVHYGIKYGVGWRQIGYDKEKKCTVRWTIDPNDLLIGSQTGKAEDAPYVIKVVIRTIGYWKNKYPKADIAPDNEIASNEYKALGMQIQYQGNTSNGQGLDEQTAKGYECWYRVFKKNKAGGLINKVLFTETAVVDYEETPFNEYPFIPYEAEIEPNELYPDGHIKDIIAPQRMLNLLNTQMLEYNHVVNRGRFVMDKNSGFTAVYAKEGQIIRKKQGASLQVLNPPAVNPLLQWQMGFAKESIQDIGGRQDATMGRLPSASLSGDALESLQAGDDNAISYLRENFEDFLSKEAAWILKMYSLFENEGVVLTEEQPDELGDMQKQQFGVVGQGAYQSMGKNVPDKYYMEDNGTYCDVCAILPDNQVKVSVTSELGETKQARLDLLLKLVELEIIPGKVVLEHLEFPNSQDILQRIAEETLAEIAITQMQSQGLTPMQPPVPPGGEGAAPPEPTPNPARMAALQALEQKAGGMLNG